MTAELLSTNNGEQYDLEKQRQELNDRLDLVSLAGRYTNLKRASHKNGAPVWKGICPLHTEKTPSFHVYEHNNTYHCFGCHAHGDAVNFLRRIEQLSDGQVFARAREMAGIITTDRAAIKRKAGRLHRELSGDAAGSVSADWKNQEWQEFAHEQINACRRRLAGAELETFQKMRGLNHQTIERFEVGWTGSKNVVARIGDRTLVVRAYSFIFPVKNPDGTIRMLKWRHTRPEDIKRYGKYGQLAGGQAGIFNLGAVLAETDQPAIVCTGEFEVMLLGQLGVTACCHTGGEGAAIDFDELFGKERAVFYIADNDAPGRQAAARKQAVCTRLKVCYPDPPHKDMTEQALAKGGGLSRTDVLRFLSVARGPEVKRHARQKTYQVTINRAPAAGTDNTQRILSQDRPENFRPELEPIELKEAREMLAKTAAQFFNHRVKARRQLLHVAAQPGTGKGFAFNAEATRLAERGEGTTLWLGPRNKMFTDQPRSDTTWKHIEGRRAAHDIEGNLVDFWDPAAVEGSGNCSVEGADYHQRMAEKGYQLYSHDYCKMVCPLYSVCVKEGYQSKLENDGRNAFTTFAHLFTTTAQKYNSLVVDEPRYQDFVNILEVTDGDLGHLLGFTYNAGMLAIMKAIREILTRPWPANLETRPAQLSAIAGNPGQEQEADPSRRINGQAFIRLLDKTLREMAGGRGLLAHLDQAEETGHWMNQQVWELIEERSAEAADRLPPNIWQPLGAKPRPGTGGLYDLLKEEAPRLLGGELPLEFESRLELVKTNPTKSARLVMHLRNYLPESVATKPIAVLDASTPPELIREMFTYYVNVQKGDREFRKNNPIWERRLPQIQTVAPLVELPVQIEIVQKTARNYAKSSLLKSYNGDPRRRYWSLFVQDVISQMRKTERALIVCCKPVEALLAQALIERGITEASGYHYAIEHYQNLRGSNAYKDYDCVIEAGAYMPQPAGTISAGRAFYAGDGKPIDPTFVRVQQLYQFRQSAGEAGQETTALADDVLSFADKRLQTLQDQEQAAEHLQVAYRIRPLDTDRPKRIVLLFAMPVPGLEVNQLITSDQAEGSAKNQRSLRVIEKLTTAAAAFKADFDSRGVATMFTAPQLAERAEVALATAYKYFEVALAGAGLEAHTVTYREKMPGRKSKDGQTVKRERLRDLSFATNAGISQNVIMALITFSEIPSDATTLLDGQPFNGSIPAEPPQLEPVEIEVVQQVAPAYQGLVSVKLLHISQLAEQFNDLVERSGGFYTLAASLKRAEHADEVAILNRLVRLHRPRRKEVQVA